jgi:DnaJ-class molecular chaperone
MPEQIVKCFKCGGKGKIRGSVDWLTGVLSGGLTALIDLSSWEECDACDGKGFIKVKEEN